MAKLIKFFTGLFAERPEFTGSVQINFFKGGISSVQVIDVRKI